MSYLPSIPGLRAKSDAPKSKDTKEMENTGLVQGCQVFSAHPLNVSDCQKHAILLLRGVMSGSRLTATDIESIFFRLTEAFKSKDLLLHRLIFLILRYLGASHDYVFMIAQSFSQEISGDLAMNRGRAVRLLPHIFRLEELRNEERSIQQMILSRDPLLAGSALSCSLSLCLQGSTEFVKKWISEIHSSLATGGSSAQFIARLILYFLRRSDGKLLQKMADQRRDLPNCSSLSNHVLIQVCTDVNRMNPNDATEKFILSKLQASSPIVQLDAIRSILSQTNASSESINLAVSRLNSMLSSPSNVALFAALRTICQYAPVYRNEFGKCNTVLERILTRENETLSALAAVALFHTGFESTIDRVLPVLSGIASKLSYDQQASILRSCVDVTRRHPSRLDAVLSFVWSSFRLVENVQVQSVLIESFFKFIGEVGGAKTSVFEYLCEYLEDSKFTSLSVRIVNFMGKYGPESELKSELVRALCNRLVLDCVEVRAAAIDSLFEFRDDAQLGASVLSIIERQLRDSDDEIRERAGFYSDIFKKGFGTLLETKVELTEAPVAETIVVVAESPIDEFGRLVYESRVVKAGSDDDEFVVSYVVRLYEDVIVFVFTIRNTLKESVNNVTIGLEPQSGGVEQKQKTTIESLASGQSEDVVVVLERERDTLLFQTFTCTVLFQQEDDVDTVESFECPDVDVTIGTYMESATVNNFASEFDHLSSESTSALGLTHCKTTDEAIRFLMGLTGMTRLAEDGETVVKGQKFTVVHLGGRILGKELVLGRIEVSRRPVKSGGIIVTIRVKSDTKGAADMVLRSMGADES
jgi:coatomer protein complex subunit gamma